MLSSLTLTTESLRLSDLSSDNNAEVHSIFALSNIFCLAISSGVNSGTGVPAVGVTAGEADFFPFFGFLSLPFALPCRED